MKKIQIWHNANCSKSRAALELLKNKNINPNVFDYLEQTLSEKQLKDILLKLNIKASELLRTGENIYKELDLENIIDEEKLINIMVLNPILIERPIIIKDDIAVIARPIEKLEELLK